MHSRVCRQRKKGVQQSWQRKNENFGVSRANKELPRRKGRGEIFFGSTLSEPTNTLFPSHPDSPASTRKRRRRATGKKKASDANLRK